MATPHKCPVCLGSGAVKQPPPFATGDNWLLANAVYTCQACKGTGVVWEPDIPKLATTHTRVDE